MINVDLGYVFRPEQLVLTPTAAEGIRLLNDAGHLVIVATNQSGVARRLYEEADVARFHAHLQEELGRCGAHIDAFYYCIHHRDGIVPALATDHADRKPNPGMLIRAMRDLPVDPDRSFMIGDKASDVAAAHAAGIPGYLVPANVCDLAAEVRKIIQR